MFMPLSGHLEFNPLAGDLKTQSKESSLHDAGVGKTSAPRYFQTSDRAMGTQSILTFSTRSSPYCQGLEENFSIVGAR